MNNKDKEQALVPYSKEFVTQIKKLKADMHKQYMAIGAEVTPQFDGAGNPIIEKRKDGYKYIVETYMRKNLDKHFPGWSWEEAAPLHFLGGEWVVAQGHLVIIDEHLLAFGIMPPTRRFYGVDAIRIQYKQGAPHNTENIVDVGDSCKGANANAFKYAVNRLTNIGDDVYGKQIVEEGGGNIEEIITTTDDKKQIMAMFNQYIDKHDILISKVCEICGVGTFAEIADFKDAYEKVKQYIENK